MILTPVDTDGVTRGPAGSLDRMHLPDFYVTPLNRFAHAAAHAVAEHPLIAYNPLWIYGTGSRSFALAEALSEALLRSGAAFHYIDARGEIICDVQALVDEGVQVVIASKDEPGDYQFMRTHMAQAVMVG